MALRLQSEMGECETRTQGALVAALRARPRTPYRAVQCVLGAKASLFSSLLDLNVRFYVDRESGEPHFARHGLSEHDLREVLANPLEDRPGQEGARTALCRSHAGRYIRVVYVPDSVFVITAYEIGPKAKLAVVRRLRRKP